jgi:tetratricopeptide (TPR) repeat protein
MDYSPGQLKELGTQAYQKGEFASAANYFHQAELAYQTQGEPLQAAEMANNCSVAYLQAGNARAALEAAQDTSVVFAQAGDHLREGFALGNQAAALKELGKKNESLQLYRLSAEKLTQAGDKENLIAVNKNIAALEFEKGNQLNSMSAMLDAIRGKEKLTLREKIMRKLFSIVARLLP